MNGVLGWVKTNWLIVVFCVVMVAALVAGYIGSGMWGTSMREEFQGRVQQQMQQVQGAKVTYSIPTLTPEEQAVSESGPPNAAKTAWYAQRIEARVAQADALVQEAEDFNRGRNQAGSNRVEHGALIPGLFPAPSDARTGERLRYDFRDAVIGARGNPSALATLLQRYGVGPAADLRRVETVLSDVLDRETEAVRTETGMDPDEARQARIRTMLSERRIQEFQRAARDLSMYGTEAAFRGSTIPVGGTAMTGAPDLVTCFKWQWDYWIASDILAALALANTDSDGLRTDVDRSLVKRIEAIQIAPVNLDPPSTEESWSGIEPAAPEATITGRPDPASTDYDVRYVTLRLIVASDRLPALFDALARTNYMSVIDFDIKEVDGWAHLRQGFYYGADHVVQATLRVETIWLRSWTGPFMPQSVRDVLGVVVPEPVEAGNG